jgi:uncharacterized membrane protein YkvA (DUF1232 family)
MMMHRLAITLLWMWIPRILPSVLRYGRLVWRLTFDKRIHLMLRALVPLALLYVLSPLDLIKDTVPVFGHFDDLFIVVLAVLLLTKLAPRFVIDEHLGVRPNSNRFEDKDPSNVVDGTGRIIDEE